MARDRLKPYRRGHTGESLAAVWLRLKGYLILARRRSRRALPAPSLSISPDVRDSPGMAPVLILSPLVPAVCRCITGMCGVTTFEPTI
jgi:hypothetical protein